MTISLPVELHDYVTQNRGVVTASEYIRSLIRRDRERRADYAARPKVIAHRANETATFVEALQQLEKLKAILEQNESYFD